MDMPPTEMPTEEAPQAGAVEICIKVAPDGRLSVYKETGEEGAMAAPAEEQPAADIGQALKLALDLYRGLDRRDLDANKAFDEGFGRPASARQTGSFR